MSFEKIIPFTLQHEGGVKVTHDPNDPGGTTKYGIAQRSHPSLDIEKLTEEQAKEIYRAQYWIPISKGIDDNLDMVSFDSAVNLGVGRVRGFLDKCDTWQDLIALRRNHYKNIIAANPTLAKYAIGWENRVKDLENFIQEG